MLSVWNKTYLLAAWLRVAHCPSLPRRGCVQLLHMDRLGRVALRLRCMGGNSGVASRQTEPRWTNAYLCPGVAQRRLRRVRQRLGGGILLTCALTGWAGVWTSAIGLWRGGRTGGMVSACAPGATCACRYTHIKAHGLHYAHLHSHVTPFARARARPERRGRVQAVTEWAGEPSEDGERA
jgi:hypothetical protein